MRRIAVIGTGYLGTTHAACLAELGFEVLGVDTDRAKIERLQRGEVPFFEPHLSALLRTHTASGRLRFTACYAEAASFADTFFLCIGTPQAPGSLAADVGQLFQAVERLAPLVSRHTLLVGKSTVPVGTAQTLAVVAEGLAPADVEVELAWNPEFLREGHAVEDTLSPERLVVGVTSASAEQALREVYASQVDDGVPLVVTDLASAELVKCAANAFLATKISFINMMAELCDAAEADVLAVARALGLDGRIGSSFLVPGAGFGGGCLPKDIRALTARADELGVADATSFLRGVDRINLRARGRIVEMTAQECGGMITGRTIAVLGSAFKPFTDDVRDSPALDIAARLHERGAEVRVYDPRANAAAAASFPALHHVDEPHAALRGADVVLHLTDWPQFRELDPALLVDVVAEPCLIDGRNTLDADRWRAAGWRYRAPGRRAIRSGSSRQVQPHATAP